MPRTNLNSIQRLSRASTMYTSVNLFSLQYMGEDFYQLIEPVLVYPYSEF
jgi:hypothetical protein